MLIETLTSENDRNFNHIFLNRIDTVEFNETVKTLNQEDTFFIVSSKSFSTDETLQSLALSEHGWKPNVNLKITLRLPLSQIKLKILVSKKT